MGNMGVTQGNLPGSVPLTFWVNMGIWVWKWTPPPSPLFALRDWTAAASTSLASNIPERWSRGGPDRAPHRVEVGESEQDAYEGVSGTTAHGESTSWPPSGLLLRAAHRWPAVREIVPLPAVSAFCSDMYHCHSFVSRTPLREMPRLQV